MELRCATPLSRPLYRIAHGPMADSVRGPRQRMSAPIPTTEGNYQPDPPYLSVVSARSPVPSSARRMECPGIEPCSKHGIPIARARL